MNLPTKEELVQTTFTVTGLSEKSSLGLLNKAMETQRQRAVDYNAGSGERSMQHTVDMFNVISGRSDKDTPLSLTESEGWLFMMCLKFAREAQAGNPYDSLLDLTSYSALYGESRLKESSITTADPYSTVTPFTTPEAARPSEDYAFRERMVKVVTEVKERFGRTTAKQILAYGAGVEKMKDVPADKIANVLGICEMLDAAKSTTI